MFPYLACKPEVRLDEKGDSAVSERRGKRLPGRPVQHEPEVADGDVVVIDGVGGRGGHRVVHQVSRDLVTAEIKVDPSPVGAPDSGSEDLDVELAGGRQIIDGDGQMEARTGGCHSRSLVYPGRQVKQAGKRAARYTSPVATSSPAPRLVIGLALVGALAGGLALWSLSGHERGAMPLAPSPSASPVADRSIAPAAAPSRPSRAPVPLRVATRDDDRPSVSVGPTESDLQEAYEKFDELRLHPEVSREAGDAFDLEASQRLHQKTLALRSLVEMVARGEQAGTLDPGVGADRLADARAAMALELADLPVPSYVDDPESIALYRSRIAEQALGVLDEDAPEGSEEGDGSPTP